MNVIEGGRWGSISKESDLHRGREQGKLASVSKHSGVVDEIPHLPAKKRTAWRGCVRWPKRAGRGYTIAQQRVSRAGLGPAEPVPPPLFLSPQSEVDTEYSDPFDAQPHPPPPDDGYMEPYDAQRVVSGE